MAMTWKDEVLMLWIFCTVVLAVVVRHFFGGPAHLVQQMAGFSAAYFPGLLHALAWRLR